MSQNNTIRKSDKKFIRTEKARIRRQFLDIKKQEELINNLYEKFLPARNASGIADAGGGKSEVKETKTEKEETVKIETKKESKKPEVKKEPKTTKIKK